MSTERALAEGDVERARHVATAAHAGQVDKAGRPYIEHPADVAFRVRDHAPQVQVVAWLHDVVEDTTVTLDIKAQDVAHSWWIPELGGKFDAIPGYTNHTWFKIPAKFGAKPGGTVFYGQCAELCGRNHANMIAEVRAVSVAEYQQWLAQRKTDIQDAETKAAAQRKQLESGSTTP